MEFRILGPLYADAGTGSGPALICQPLLQSALAVLLLRANRPCPRTLLIDALWGNEPPGSPEAALRVCISRLRRSLGDCAVRLDSVGPPGGRAPGHRQQRGYIMTVRPGELDIDEFADLTAQGLAELDLGNAAAAAASFVQALALWSDPPLPDLPDSDVIADEVTRLIHQRQVTIDSLVEARLAAGEYQQVLGPLRASVAADPGRERSCAQLMRAYHALGMRTEALEVYQLARHATLEQQGAEPGPALVVLYKRILAEEMASPAGHADKLSRTPLRLLSSQVPAPPADFTGRSDEIAAIIDSLTGPGVPVTIVTGAPGIGKSAAAAVAAMQLRSQFTDGQLYAELGGIESPRDPHDVLADMLQTMGIAARSIPAAAAGRAALYRSLLADRNVLVMADDAATAAQIRPLIPAANGAAVLVTSRSRLSGIAGARIVRLEPMADADAVTLIGAAAGPGRCATQSAAAGLIAQACGGLPLALRLAGATLSARPGLTESALAAELDSRRVLDVLAAEDTSVRGSVGSSYRAVRGPARAALSIGAAVIPGEIPAWALADLAGGDGTIAEQIASAGLLEPAQTEVAGARFRMHPLIRAYAIERLDDHADCYAVAVDRLRGGWFRRADHAAAGTPALPFLVRPPRVQSRPPMASGAEATWADWVEIERANLLAMTELTCAAGDHQIACALASRLIGTQCLRGTYRDAITAWRAIAAAAAEVGDQLGLAQATYFLAVALAESHDHVSEATGLLAHSLPVLEQAGELEMAAMGYALLGRCASGERRHAAAIRAVRRAQLLAGDGRDSDLIRCCARAVLGLTFARVGIIDGGAEHCRQALNDARGLREPAYQVHASKALAQVMILNGEYKAAASLCRDAVRLARECGSEVSVARMILVLCRACHRDADLAIPVDDVRTASDVFHQAGLVLEEITARSLLAACSQSAGDGPQAVTHVHEVVEILTRTGVSDAGVRATAAQVAAS